MGKYSKAVCARERPLVLSFADIFWSHIDCLLIQDPDDEEDPAVDPEEGEAALHVNVACLL